MWIAVEAKRPGAQTARRGLRSISFVQSYQHDHRLEKTRLDAYDHFYNTERTALYQIQEGHVLSHLYDLIRRYVIEEDPNEAQHLLSAIMTSFHMNTDCGTLDGNLLDHF